MPDSRFLVVAHLVRTQGRKGELIADILTDFPERFADRVRVWLISQDSGAPRHEALIERYWLHKGRIVLKFAGVDSITDAERYRGWDVAIPREERIPLPEDAIYTADLIGCHLIDENAGSANLGPVLDVARSEGGAADLLVLKMGDEELLIPFAKAYLVGIDLGNRTLRMRLPVGLTDINAPMSEEERASQRDAREDEGDGDAL